MELLEKLKLLEENIKILNTIKADSKLEEVRKNKRLEWEIRYGLFESIQIIIDIACKLSSEYNLGSPKNYKECIELLEKYHYIDKNISKKIIGMVGLRNLLIHEYATIDSQKLYNFLVHLDDFTDFIKQIGEIDDCIGSH